MTSEPVDPETPQTPQPAPPAAAPVANPAPAANPAPIERLLHPLSWLFTLWTELGKLALPAVAFVFATRSSAWWDLVWIPLAIPIVIIAVVRQLSVRYTLGDTDLVIRRHLIVHRSERTIPYERIHNLQVKETPLHRLLHVVEVAVETASGKEPEATLRVLSREAFDELRTHVAVRRTSSASEFAPASEYASVSAAATGAGAAGAAPASEQASGSPSPSSSPWPPREVVLALSLKDAILYGALDNRGFIIVAALASFAWEAVGSYEGGGLPWDPQFWRAPWRLARSGWRWLSGSALLESPLIVLAAIASALLLLKLFSIGWAIVALHGFRVERTRSSLSVTHGLITRASTMIPLHRIQQIKVREKPLHRVIGRVEVELDTVGSAGEHGQRRPVWLAPLASRDDVSRLLADAGAPIALDDVAWEPVHPRAARRMRKKRLVVLALVTMVLWGVTRRPWTLVAAAVAAPIVVAIATQQARRLAYARIGGCILIRRGWVWRTVHITWVDRVQALAVSASPFDRRHGMATLIVDTATGGPMGSELHVPYLDANLAQGLQRDLAAGVAATRFQW